MFKKNLFLIVFAIGFFGCEDKLEIQPEPQKSDKDSNKTQISEEEIEIIPTNPKEQISFFLNRGKKRFFRGKYIKAIDDFNKSIMLKESFEAFKWRGASYFGINKFKLSILDYNKAIKLNSKNSDGEIYLLRGDSYLYSNKFKKAIADYNKALTILKNRDVSYLSEIYFNIGNSYYDLGDKKNALKNYSKAIELDSTHANAYWYRGFIYMRLDKKAEAISDAIKCRDLGDRSLYDELVALKWIISQ